MSYDIQLFTAQTREREQESNDEDFFDNATNLQPFTTEQFELLKEVLIDNDYDIIKESADQVEYQHPQYNIMALLTRQGLYFNAGFNKEAIFEAGMMASEMTDDGEFAKYDPQNGGWEEL